MNQVTNPSPGVLELCKVALYEAIPNITLVNTCKILKTMVCVVYIDTTTVYRQMVGIKDGKTGVTGAKS